MERLAIIGAGSWGSALGKIAYDNGHAVLLYDNSKEAIARFNSKTTASSRIFQATTDLKEAVAFGDIILLAVPTSVIRSVLKEINLVIESEKVFVNASKGLEPKTFKRVSEIVEEEIKSKFVKGFVALSGPSHAEEVILEMLTLVTATSPDLKQAQLIQRVFSNQTYFRVYTLTDLIGVEICSALKNIIALASGIIAGLGYGDNTRAALITRGLVEIKRIACMFGAEEKTVFGLAGLGDLVVTCTSTHSRNFQAGYKIGSGKDLEQALAEMTMVVEGARSAIAAHEMIVENNIYAPIIEAVYDIIYHKFDPRERIMLLMQNDLKKEIL